MWTGGPNDRGSNHRPTPVLGAWGRTSARLLDNSHGPETFLGLYPVVTCAHIGFCGRVRVEGQGVSKGRVRGGYNTKYPVLRYCTNKQVLHFRSMSSELLILSCPNVSFVQPENR